MAKPKKVSTKKKSPARKKKSRDKKSQPLLPALIFLGMAAALIGFLYLFTGHYPSKTITTVRKSASHAKPKKALPVKTVNGKAEKKRNKPVPATGLSHLTIYRLSRDYSRILSFTIACDNDLTKTEKARLIIRYLTLPGERDQPPLPRATKLRAISFTTPLITVDLSEDIRNGLVNSGAQDEMLTAACLTNSLLANFQEYKKLQLLIDGKRYKTLAGHIDIYTPLSFQSLQQPD